MSKHIGFDKLAKKIAYNEKKAHPGWSWNMDKKVGKDTAGKIARKKGK